MAFHVDFENPEGIEADEEELIPALTLLLDVEAEGFEIYEIIGNPPTAVEAELCDYEPDVRIEI